VTIESSGGTVNAKQQRRRHRHSRGRRQPRSENLGRLDRHPPRGRHRAAHTSGGGIRIDEAMDAVDATTSGGSITARFSAPAARRLAPFDVRRRLTVELASGIGAELDARAKRRRRALRRAVTVQGSRDEDSLVGPFNGGGPASRLRNLGRGDHAETRSIDRGIGT